MPTIVTPLLIRPYFRFSLNSRFSRWVQQRSSLRKSVFGSFSILLSLSLESILTREGTDPSSPFEFLSFSTPVANADCASLINHRSIKVLLGQALLHHHRAHSGTSLVHSTLHPAFCLILPCRHRIPPTLRWRASRCTGAEPLASRRRRCNS